MVRSRLFACTLAVAWCSAALIEAAAETVMLNFTQAGCGPCAAMEPVLAQVNAQQRCRIQTVDLPSNPSLARKYCVDVTPTFIVLIDGREWARVTGFTSYATMTEMLEKSAALAAAHVPGGRNAVAAFDFGEQATPTPAPADVYAAATTPREGRVVPISDPFAVHRRSRAEPSPTPASATASADHLIAATVRLSITDSRGKSTGTGAIVDVRNGMALVLTCGHLFRESQGQGAVEISIFTAGPNGAELRGTVAGELLDYDLDRDLALVRFRTESPVAVAPIAPAGTLLLPDAPATCVGCSHGENPTAWATRIKSLNRYQGYPNVEAERAPVEGRSGGGLYNAQGQLIGVCYAAEPQGDEGLYASLASIHEKLNELQMASVYESPSLGVPTAAPTAIPAAIPGNQLAGNPASESVNVRGQSPDPASSTTLPSAWPASALTEAGPAAVGPIAPPPAPATAAPATATVAALTPAERATLEEIARRSNGAEVICIIRPHSPDGRSDVIKLSGVTPAFVQALLAAGASASPDGPPAAGAAAATASNPGAYVR